MEQEQEQYTSDGPRFFASILVCSICILLVVGVSGIVFIFKDGIGSSGSGDDSDFYYQRMNFLVVSDIHTRTDIVEQLQNELNEKGVLLDFILCAGDIADLQSSSVGNATNANEEQAETDLNNVLNALNSISPNIFYVPGNHDPTSSFAIPDEENAPPTTGIVNVHGRVVKIADQLYIAGMGGSVPAYAVSDTHKTQVVWDGYPYNTEAELAAKLTTLKDEIEDALHDDANETATLIVLNHNGPSGVDSTIAVDEQVDMGSTAVRSFLESDIIRQKAILDVHGHTHSGIGFTRVGKIRVMNPGSLRNNNYALVKIYRDKHDLNAKWGIERLDFLEMLPITEDM